MKYINKNKTAIIEGIPSISGTLKLVKKYLEDEIRSVVVLVCSCNSYSFYNIIRIKAYTKYIHTYFLYI